MQTRLGYYIGYLQEIKKTANINVDKKSTQRAQTSADPEDPDFGLWTTGSEA